MRTETSTKFFSDMPMMRLLSWHMGVMTMQTKMKTSIRGRGTPLGGRYTNKARKRRKYISRPIVNLTSQMLIRRFQGSGRVVAD